ALSADDGSVKGSGREERHSRQREDPVRVAEQGIRRDPQEVWRADERRRRWARRRWRGRGPRRRGGSGERSCAHVDAQESARGRVGNAERGVSASVQRGEARAAQGGDGGQRAPRQGERGEPSVGKVRSDDQGSYRREVSRGKRNAVASELATA